MHMKYIAYRYAKNTPSPCTYSDFTVAVNTASSYIVVVANAGAASAEVATNNHTTLVDADMNLSCHEFICSMQRVDLFLP